MFEEMNKQEEQGFELPDKLFGSDETEIPADDRGEEVSGKKEEITAAPDAEESSAQKEESPQNAEIPSPAAARAREHIRMLEGTVGLPGKWEKLFGSYPGLSREETYAELGEKVRSGFTPLEAYQQKLLDERTRELQIARRNSELQRKSVGSLLGDGSAGERDAFLEGFFSDNENKKERII